MKKSKKIYYYTSKIITGIKDIYKKFQHALDYSLSQHCCFTPGKSIQVYHQQLQLYSHPQDYHSRLVLFPDITPQPDTLGISYLQHPYLREDVIDQPPDQPLHPVLCPHDCLLLPGQHVLQGEGESGGWWSWNYLQAEVSGFRDWRSNESILSFNRS